MTVPRVRPTLLGWGALVFGVLVSSTLMVASSLERAPTPLELTLFQVLSFVLTTVGSYMLGRDAAKAVADDKVRPLARSAINRVVALGKGLQAIGIAIEERRSFLISVAGPDIPKEHMNQSLDLLAALAVSEARTAADAIKDWEEFVPERVSELTQKARGNTSD